MNSLLERSIAYTPQVCPSPALPKPKSAQILLDSTGRPSPPPERLGFLKKFTNRSSSHNHNSTNRNNNNGFSPSSSPVCGGGGDEGGGSGALHQYDGGGDSSSSPLSSALASPSQEKQREEEAEKNSSEVRSFWCLNVGPNFDGAQWRRFGDEEEFQGRACLLPCELQAEIMWELVSKGKKVGAGELACVKEEVEGWYRAQGFIAAKVEGFSGLAKGLLCCRINEGIITEIRVCFKNQTGEDASGTTTEGVVSRQICSALEEGMIYNKNNLKQVKRRLEQLQLFNNVKAEVTMNDLGGVSVEFILQEKPQNACNFESGLSFISSDSGRPILSSLRPAATLSVEHRNISGMNRAIHGHINCNDLLRPQDDSRFKLEYVHPFVDGVDDPAERTLRVSCYNSRKLTAVVASPFEPQVPVMWVDRAGLKTSITESFSEESNMSYGFVLEEIATREGLGFAPEARIEHVPFFQGKITRDNTVESSSGFRAGAVDTFQVDQGVGFSNKALLFNKHELSLTRFIPLRLSGSSAGASSFPLVIVKGRYGGIVGDSPGYQDFPVRGSSGSSDCGSCTSFLEVTSEARVPVWKDYAYGFVDVFSELDGVLYHGQGLRSLARNAGNSLLLGVGLKTGEFRTEFVFDCGANAGSFNVQLGDRI